MGWIFPRACVHCQLGLEEGFFCEDCRYLLEIDTYRGVVYVEPSLLTWVKRIQAQPLPFLPLLEDFLRVCLEAPRLEGVTTLAISKKDPLFPLVKRLIKDYGWKLTTLEEGWFSYWKTGRRTFVDEIWAIVELYPKNQELQLYKIPKKIVSLPLLVPVH